MSDQPLQSFQSRVRGRLDELHPAERRLAELICEFPGEMASYSASELAALAGVSNATVTRFVRSLGYKSFLEARRHAREESRTGSRLFLERPADAGDSDWFRVFNEQSRRNLDTSLAAIGGDQIDAVARAILGARRVFVIGYRTNNSFATYLHWQLVQVVENVVAAPGGGQTMGEHLVNVAADDVVVLFGLRRRVKQFGAILDATAATGAKLLLVTDEAARRRSNVAWHFRCDTHTPGALFDHVAVTALCYLLVSRVIHLSGAAGRARLRAIEALHERLSEL